MSFAHTIFCKNPFVFSDTTREKCSFLADVSVRLCFLLVDLFDLHPLCICTGTCKTFFFNTGTLISIPPRLAKNIKTTRTIFGTAGPFLQDFSLGLICLQNKLDISFYQLCIGIMPRIIVINTKTSPTLFSVQLCCHRCR